jgi:hypothetical protein
MSSILSPDKDIPEHRGPDGGVLRYHLGVIIPDEPDSCGIIVNGEKAHWEEGKSLIFDDSFAHRARNMSDQLRVVLFVDFERPVRPPFNALNRWMIGQIWRSEFVTAGLENIGIADSPSSGSVGPPVSATRAAETCDRRSAGPAFGENGSHPIRSMVQRMK